jgi:phosphoribosylformimino-5-aminoimidazole carboxamide ribotide isomerase
MTKIIPAIDLIDGKCVRLEKGDYAKQKTYNENPLEVAKSFEAHGITHLHLVDLDGAKASKIINHKILETIATQTSLKIDFGGGIKSEESLHIAFNSGASQVSIGSMAVKLPTLFFEILGKFGQEKIILSADVKDKKIAISGWLEDSEKEYLPFLEEYFNKGVKYATITDISKDGMLSGIDFDFYKEISDSVPDLHLILSGGVKDTNDIEKAIEANYYGIIIGKAIYEGKITLTQLEKYNTL